MVLKGQPFSTLLTEVMFFTFTDIPSFFDSNHCHPDYCDGENSNPQFTSVSILILATK